MLRHVLPFAGALLLITPAVTVAQAGRPRFEAGVTVGTVRGVGSAFGCVTAHPMTVGARLRYQPARRFALEAGVERTARADDRFCINDPPGVPSTGPYTNSFDFADVSSGTFPFWTAGLRLIAWPIVADYVAARVQLGVLRSAMLGPWGPVAGAGVEIGPSGLRGSVEVEFSRYRFASTAVQETYLDGQQLTRQTSRTWRSDVIGTVRLGVVVPVAYP